MLTRFVSIMLAIPYPLLVIKFAAAKSCNSSIYTGNGYRFVLELDSMAQLGQIFIRIQGGFVQDLFDYARVILLSDWKV